MMVTELERARPTHDAYWVDEQKHVKYLWNPRDAVFLTFGPTGEVVSMHEHVHNRQDAEDTVILCEAGMPAHLHQWEKIDGAYRCHCTAVFTNGRPTYPAGSPR